MPDPIDPFPIVPVQNGFRVSLTPPGSKSLTNRALLLAALAEGRSRIHRPVRADDTLVMVQALRQLGVEITIVERHVEQGALGNHVDNWECIEVEGMGGRLLGGARLDCHNAGTAARFLTAAAALADGPVVIDGNERMRQRPMGQLFDAMRQLGVGVEPVDGAVEGCLPVRVVPMDGDRQDVGKLVIPPTRSSQFVSALLMIAPLLRNGMEIKIQPPITSASYIAMTLGLMDRFGATIEASGSLDRLRVEHGHYQSIDYTVEPDASSATYFLAAAAVCPGSVCTIEGLGKRSLQPDVGFADVLYQMGTGLTFTDDSITVLHPGTEGLHGVDVDMSMMPDAALTLVVVALFARGKTVIRGLQTLRFKETDRLGALKRELEKFGAGVEIEDDELLVIEPAVLSSRPDAYRDEGADSDLSPIEIETYNDHRMAMAYAVAGLLRSGVSIRNPGCVEKTYPGFWGDLCRLPR